MSEASSNLFPMVSIIIVNLDGKKWLKRCIPSVLKSNYPTNMYEIILVDNASKDGSVEFVNKAYPRVKTINLQENIGWSPANNCGIKSAKGDVFLCLSNDMEVDANWIREITRFITNAKNVGIIQCNSLSMWDRKTLDSSMNYLDKFGYSYGYRPSENPQEVFFAEGMAFAVKREVVNRIGILDDYYFMEYDDMDYSWRARLAGYRVYFLPSAIVYHARGGTVGRTYFERVKNLKWYTRNHLVTIIKNYEIRNLIKILPAVLIIETTKILYILFIKKNVKLSFAAMFGISEIIRDWKLIYVKRMNVKKVRRVPDKTILKQMHPFVPRLFYSFLVEQSRGKRFISDASPPQANP